MNIYWSNELPQVLAWPIPTMLITWTISTKMHGGLDSIPRTWWKHIDDIFAIRMYAIEHLVNSIERINQYHFPIDFITDWIFVFVTFLDTSVPLEERLLVTYLYNKRTDAHQHLICNICHPCHYKVPYLSVRLFMLNRFVMM